ncbi:two-component regulator propeller domain-containing protein [Mucilaginibacter lappiensis]|uniref:two-component regulator propeller domain-containing protein n=1 Tax=Mucilaginibacter lappiensis TaxID=354630 RepID=UPI0037C6A423
MVGIDIDGPTCCIQLREKLNTCRVIEGIILEQRGNSHGPNNTTRNIIQDRKGNIWIAAFDGIFRYDGKSFTNITSKVSSEHFFSVLEDRSL